MTWTYEDPKTGYTEKVTGKSPREIENKLDKMGITAARDQHYCLLLKLAGTWVAFSIHEN